MPTQQLGNTAGLFGETATVPGQIIEWYVSNNTLGSLLTAGDVVSIDVTGTKVISTATAADIAVLGVVAGDNTLSTTGPSYDRGAMVPVVVRGPARINIGANTVNLVTTLNLLTATATAKQATGVTSAATLIGTIIGVPLETSAAKDTTTNTIRCYIQKM